MKVAAYLSGKTKEDFKAYLDGQKAKAEPPARVTQMGTATYLIRKGLEAEKRRRSRG